MEVLRFGAFCSIISDSVAEYRKLKKPSDFSTDEEIINELHRIATASSTQDFKDRYDSRYGNRLNKGRCSRLKNGKDEIIQKVIRFLLSSIPEQRIAVMTKEFETLGDSHFSRRYVALHAINIIDNLPFPQTSLRHNASYPAIEDYQLDITYLKQLCEEENYSEVLASILFFIMAYVSNKKEDEQEQLTELQSRHDVSSPNVEAIKSNQFFQSFYRDVKIASNIKERHLYVKTETTYLSSFINPRLPEESNRFNYRFKFDNEKECREHTLKKLIINGIDYTENIIVKISEPNYSNFPFQKEYMVDNIPQSSLYTVETVVEAITLTPIYLTNYRLKAPCKSFSLKISIVGKRKNLFKLHFSLFSPIIQDKYPNFIDYHPDSNHASCGIFEWLPIGAGYNLNVLPKFRYWPDFKPNPDQDYPY